MANLLSQSAVRLTARLAAGTLTAEDLMQATLDQIAQTNTAANAIVSLRQSDDLLAEAHAADQIPAKGPLHGLPIAVKDLANVAGLPTSKGSPVFAGQVAQTSDIMVQRLQDAGAIIIGKTNTPEFGLGSNTYNPVFGATENALEPGRTAGGSSGGAAVALAHNMVALADGSDMMGSLRNPAGWNGVYGMRPSWGLVPSEPEGDSFLHQLSTNGPMARSPHDLALMLSVQSGPDPRQPHGTKAFEFPDQLNPSSDLKLGWLSDWGGANPYEAGVLDACEDALDILSNAGCIVEDVAPPFPAQQLWQSWTTLRSWAIAAGIGPLYDDPRTRERLKPEAVWEVEQGRALSAMDVHAASVIRSQWFKQAVGLFESYDALLLPTAQCFPFPIDEDWPKEIAGTKMDTYHRWMEAVIPVSLIGLPAVAVPLKSKRPMGLQLIGKRGDDYKLLELAQLWHETSGA